jgi:hypothetical protein
MIDITYISHHYYSARNTANNRYRIGPPPHLKSLLCTVGFLFPSPFLFLDRMTRLSLTVLLNISLPRASGPLACIFSFYLDILDR